MSRMGRTRFEDRIDLNSPVEAICKALDVDISYVAEIQLKPDKATVTLYRGKDGHCKGPKHILTDSGVIATEILTFEVRT